MIYISHLLTDEEMRELVVKTGAGIESIEFSIAENLDHYQEKLASYRQRLREIGCTDLILHGPFLDLNPASYDPSIRQVTWERYARCYEAARELGAKKVVYHSCMYPDIYFVQGWAERAAEFFGDFLRDRKDVEVLVENVYDRTPQPLAELMRIVKADNFRLCFDMGHAWCYGKDTDIREWVRHLTPYVSHVHVHDNDGCRDSHLALTEGTIPLKQICFFDQPKERMTYSIECCDEQSVRKTWRVLRDRYFS